MNSKAIKGIFLISAIIFCIILTGCNEYTDPSNETVQAAVLNEEYEEENEEKYGNSNDEIYDGSEEDR
ncbi:hypothetical protein [Methanococcus maripaludis]|uniref:Uncharacterized protein n=2 Tax=Methanococcus maripaludis TaxID=39152 RepID=A0A7J9PD85_METMI|nr:hypothetical protein [Methanococcus maripaludis]MBA2861203.1 hypothetical protein [Methanococcus maripaludis]